MTEGVCVLYSGAVYICHFPQSIVKQCGCGLYSGAPYSQENTLILMLYLTYVYFSLKCSSVHFNALCGH